jgi:hypothetical protein
VRAGLSLMIERLTRLLAGQPILLVALTGGDKRHRQNAAVIAINIAALTNIDDFKNTPKIWHPRLRPCHARPKRKIFRFQRLALVVPSRYNTTEIGR